MENRNKKDQNLKDLKDTEICQVSGPQNHDIFIYRKRKANNGSFKKNNDLRIKIELEKSCFIVFDSVMSLLNAKTKDAVMFAFNKKGNCAYIFKETPADDSYILNDTKRGYHRFSNKMLRNFFVDFFNIKLEGSIYFEVDSKTNEKGMFKLKIKE
jgi:hypothetical protein